MIGRSAGRVIGLLLVVCSLAPAAPADESPEKAAQAAQVAAEKWLLLVDGGQYGESWKQAAAFFREKVTREQWESAIRSVHAQTGKLVSRKWKSAQYTKSLPGAPPGEYVILQYDASFEKARSVTETITPMKDPDGVWRVSGYYVK